jgi:hypothetical protein
VFIAFAATVTHAQVLPDGDKHPWRFEDAALAVPLHFNTDFPSRKRLCFGKLDSSALIFINETKAHIFNPADNCCENPPMIIDNKKTSTSWNKSRMSLWEGQPKARSIVYTYSCKE